MVPGHEITGVVKAVGSKVSKFKVGDRVGVGCFVDSCRTCPECRRGLEQYCAVRTSWTYNGREKDETPTYGGYSEKIWSMKITYCASPTVFPWMRPHLYFAPALPCTRR